MNSFKQILESWNLFLEKAEVKSTLPKSLRVLDFDHTVAFTGEKVYIMSPEGKKSGELSSEEYTHHQESEEGIRNYFETIGIDHSTIRVVGVGSSAPEKKVDEVKKILESNPSIETVSFFDDSSANTDEMMRFLKKYEKESGAPVFFDIARVESDGKLTRMPGYRVRRN